MEPRLGGAHCCAAKVAPLLQAQPGDRILDACAAPGGKSTHLAELIKDEGEIWAVDRSPGRLQRVAANAARLGLGSISALAADAAGLPSERPTWKNSFQRILIDAPCSGLGTLARHPDARWRITPAAIDGLLPLQRDLLEGLLPLLAPQGRLVYATCTIHPAENIRQIDQLLERHPEMSQRQLAVELGVSLGGVNYALKALVERGFVKADNFRKSGNKVAYLYVLTPQGVAEKASLATAFLSRKLEEYEVLRQEIETLKGEVDLEDSLKGSKS